MTCRICNSNHIADKFYAREMLQGSRLEFEYFICADCSTVQIMSTNLDMSKYYNGAYYSLNDSIKSKKNFLSGLRNDFIFAGKNQITGRFLEKIFPIYSEHKVVASFLQPDRHLLDIGCGNGDFLRTLRASGVKKLTGIEPFLAESIEIDSDFKLIKGDISSLDEKFDLIRLHHVFEHVPNPRQTLHQISGLMNDNAIVILTIPIADFVFRKYKQHAYVLQSPHHFHLFSIKGISELLTSCGFFIDSLIRNAKGISNWLYISELWCNDVSIDELATSSKEFDIHRKMKQFKLMEKELIKEGLGDNLTLVLKKVY
ncbi:MAG: class I SAM-dependent methyltransferase [Sediminibacterium sp.]|jgi:2-polyprenyl-3-methyl-5-hydroxy-6-metoxy-1,4-benzoquinol methylase|nr:class I SAM-dependent methyltransferase [Sediminibacterium sp.]